MTANLLLILSIGILLALAAGAFLFAWRTRGAAERLVSALTVAQADAARLEAETGEWSRRTAENEELIRELVGERAALQAKLEVAEQKLQEEIARHDRERADRVQAEETLRAQFRNLANDILGEQSQKFQQSSKESIDLLLSPFRQHIAEFRERIEKIHAAESEQYGGLKNELKNLMALNDRITTETSNLTRALKGDSKVQGDYGEMILDTILSSSNLIKGVHYVTQDTLRNEQGANVRPDVVLNLPDRKQIVIDSKTSLTAYVEFTASERPEERDRLIKNHLDSVRRHVAELSAKSYQDLLEGSPDFVIMFIPNESAFLAAMQADPQIWTDAYRKKVVVSSPTNLFALLKLVDNLWQRSDLERNTRDIAECGSKIYDQLVAFADSLTDVEKGLKQAQRSYDEAYKRFTTGNNNLVRLGERMAGLHVKVKKSLPQPILDTAELDK